MMTVPHVLVGGATAVTVAQITDNPILIVGSAILSHYVADMIPHFDVPPSLLNEKGQLIGYTPYLWGQVFVDVGLAFAISMYFWVTRFNFPDLLPFALGAFGGFLPDIIDNVPFWNKFFHKLPGFKQEYAFHESTHHLWTDHFPMKKYWYLGIVTQVFAVIWALGVLL